MSDIAASVYEAANLQGLPYVCGRMMHADPELGKADRVELFRWVNRSIPLWVSRTYRMHKPKAGKAGKAGKRKAGKADSGRSGLLVNPSPPKWHFRHPRACQQWKNMEVHPTTCEEISLHRRFCICGGRFKLVSRCGDVYLYERVGSANGAESQPITGCPTDHCAWGDHGDPPAYRMAEREKVAAKFEIDVAGLCDVQGLALHPDVAAHFEPRLTHVYFRAVQKPRLSPGGVNGYFPWETLADRELTTETVECYCMSGYPWCRSRYARLLPCVRTAVAACRYVNLDRIRIPRLSPAQATAAS